MLVLSRKTGQSVIVGEHIKVTILSNNGYLVRIGFEAPIDIAIHREEVALRIQNDCEKQICTCKGIARTFDETNNGKWPASEHAPSCALYQLELFYRIVIDNKKIIIEKDELLTYLTNEQESVSVEVVKMTRDQFENLKLHE